jgi:hypothetical protein
MFKITSFEQGIIFRYKSSNLVEHNIIKRNNFDEGKTLPTIVNAGQKWMRKRPNPQFLGSPRTFYGCNT